MPTQRHFPTSVRLKSNIKTPNGKYIIRKAERALLNERIRSINNSIAMFKSVRDTCKNQLESMVDKGTMEKCNEFIETRREIRHLKTLDRHLSKFNRLCPWDGVHGENGHIDTCTATTIATTKAVEQRNLGNFITNSGDNNNNNSTSASTNIAISSTHTSSNTINGNWVRNSSKPPWQKHKNDFWLMGLTLFWYPGNHQPVST